MNIYYFLVNLLSFNRYLTAGDGVKERNIVKKVNYSS